MYVGRLSVLWEWVLVSGFFVPFMSIYEQGCTLDPPFDPCNGNGRTIHPSYHITSHLTQLLLCSLTHCCSLQTSLQTQLNSTLIALHGLFRSTLTLISLSSLFLLSALVSSSSSSSIPSIYLQSSIFVFANNTIISSITLLLNPYSLESTQKPQPYLTLTLSHLV